MIDKQPHEQRALEGAIKPVAEIVGEIGFTKSFADMTKEQILTIIEGAVTGYNAALLADTVIDPAILDDEIPF